MTSALSRGILSLSLVRLESNAITLENFFINPNHVSEKN